MTQGHLRSTIRIAASFIFLLATTTAVAAAASALQPLVSAGWLKAHLGQKDLLVLDIRPKEDFEAGHIPGAVNGAYPDLWRQADWTLLPLKALTGNLSALGVGDGVTVILVPAGGDGTELGGATFAYWVLKYLGHADTAILDGGWTGLAVRPDRSG